VDIISDLMSGTHGVKLYKINSSKYVCQHRLRLFWTNIPYDPNKPVQAEHPLTLKELIGDGYEGVLMRKFSKYGDGCDKFIPDRPLAQTITKHKYKANTQTLPVGYTEPAGSETQRSYCIGNCWTVAVVEDILSGMIP
jgi:site-specific DNA-cytosine methylase